MWLFLPGLIIELIGVIILIAAMITGSLPGILTGIFFIGSAVAVHLFQITKRSRTSRDAAERDQSIPLQKLELSDDEKILYSDTLVTITENAITFQNYSLFLKPRRINFTDIDHIDVLEPALFTGKYRM